MGKPESVTPFTGEKAKALGQKGYTGFSSLPHRAHASQAGPECNLEHHPVPTFPSRCEDVRQIQHSSHSCLCNHPVRGACALPGNRSDPTMPAPADRSFPTCKAAVRLKKKPILCSQVGVSSHSGQHLWPGWPGAVPPRPRP